MRQQSISAISAENIVKSFGKTTALTGVNLEISGGNVTAILGANGAGKTTFINCALGLVRPDKGRLRIQGKPAGSLRARRKIGVMLQDADLPEKLTAREHLNLFASYYPFPFDSDHIIDLCNIEDFADKPYGKLSGGQKRRVQFAVALIGQPDIIFLDEPTTGLDSEARRGLWQIIRTLNESGKTVILTTHYLEEADSLADRIVVMNGGTILADDKTENIRNLTGGALIRCVTQVSIATLETLPDVNAVRQSGRFVIIRSTNQTETLKALFNLDPDISDLTVTKPGLEEAFLNITNEEEGVI